MATRQRGSIRRAPWRKPVSEASHAVLSRIIKESESDIVDEWTRDQLSGFRSGTKIKEVDLRNQSTEFLNLLRGAIQSGNLTDVHSPAFGRVRDMLSDLSRSRS